MRKTRKATKLLCLVVSVMMLMGMLSAGFTASAASVTVTPKAYEGFVNGAWVTTSDGAANLTKIDGTQSKTLSAGTYYYVFGTANEWYVTRSSTVAIVTVSDNGSVTVSDGTFAQVSWNQANITPSSTHTAVLNNGELTWGGEGSSVTIKDGAGNVVNGSASVGVEEGSIFFTADTAYTPVTWSLADNSIGATLNGNYNGGALVSFNKVGNVTLVATDSNGGKAQVIIGVNNNTIQLNASTVEGTVANGSTLTIEKGQAVDVLVDCTDPSKLGVTQSGNAVTVSRGTTGVPVTILGANVGSSQITLDLYGKTLTFTVKVNEATSANFLANGSPIVGLTTVDVNTTVKVTCSLAVTSWAVTGGDTSAITVAKNSDGSANITGKTVGGLATVTAYGANNTVLGTFDVYVTESGSSGGYYMNILDSNRADVTSASLNVNESKQFIADCTIVAGSTNVVWELTNVSPAGCITLTTGGNDGNGNPMATVMAKAQGTAVLKATANGKTDSITINVGGAVETGKEIVMKFDATKAYVDGSVYPTTQYATGYATLTNVNGTAMMPLRYIAEVSGFDVAYDEATQKTKVTNKANGEYLLVTPGSNAVSKYSSAGALLGTTNAPSAFTINNGVTMGPLRYTCESLGMFVNYQETNHGIYVTVTSTAVSASDALALIEKAYGFGL